MIDLDQLTQKTASLAAMASISAQDTTPGHVASIFFFASSMISYPRRLRFAGESFSAVLSFVESSRTEASHPFNWTSKKKTT